VELSDRCSALPTGTIQYIRKKEAHISKWVLKTTNIYMILPMIKATNAIINYGEIHNFRVSV
jgi:hypothetical protein